MGGYKSSKYLSDSSLRDRVVEPAAAAAPDIGTLPGGQLRCTDADRDEVAGKLRQAYADGALDDDVFGRRLTVALSAVSRTTLERLTTDLPRPVRRCRHCSMAGGIHTAHCATRSEGTMERAPKPALARRVLAFLDCPVLFVWFLACGSFWSGMGLLANWMWQHSPYIQNPTVGDVALGCGVPIAGGIGLVVTVWTFFICLRITKEYSAS